MLSWPPEIFTTSETLDTDTRPSSTAPRMLPLDSFLDPPSSRRPPWTSENESKKTSTGRAGMRPRRMALDAAADATLTLLTLRARTAHAWLSGWTLPVAGPRHKRVKKPGSFSSSSFGNLNKERPDSSIYRDWPLMKCTNIIHIKRHKEVRNSYDSLSIHRRERKRERQG